MRSIISDNNTLNTNCNNLQTTIYTFFDKFNIGSCLNRYDKMKPLFLFVFFSKSHLGILGRKMGYVWIGFYIIYRLHVPYSNKVLFSMFVNVNCLLWCDCDRCFRLLSALPVKIFKIAMFFYSSLVYMRPIFCRCFLFLIIGNMLW